MYLELEKERNASATTANEAMGMIARLQEKAAVLMEARQFQQVVEQKSMHDQEAIEGLREVIARIEEEKRELEEENEFCRSIEVTPCADRGEHTCSKHAVAYRTFLFC
ncbi:hypothetical protein CY35_04G121200 [Sphagnum magellanicum]|nr:hypothetical protein CY35_04G121200 [Sphagnum magellanicum]